MLAFSVNHYCTMDITDEMKELLEQNQRNISDRSSVYCEELGDLYLRMADPHTRKTVSGDVAAKAYILKAKQNNEIKYKERYVPIISQSEADDEKFNGYGISENVLSKVDSDIERIEGSSEFKACLMSLMQRAKDIELTDDIDLFLTMYAALRGDITAVNCIKFLKDKYTDGFADELKVVLSGDWTSYIPEVA